MHAYMCTYAHRDTNMCTHTYMHPRHIHICVHIHKCIHKYMYTLVCRYIIDTYISKSLLVSRLMRQCSQNPAFNAVCNHTVGTQGEGEVLTDGRREIKTTLF